MPLINITLSDQMKSFMDERHYDPNEIDDLTLSPTTNGKVTWYVDGTNGSDSYDGLFPDNSLGGLHGPFKTPERAWRNEDSHSYGERVLIRTGIYKIPFGTGIGMNLTGTPDDFVIGPYGDGEVVFDFSDTDLVNPFELLSQDIYKATYIDAASIFNPNHIIMDWEMRNARKAKARYGNDNSGVNNKTTSMVDTRRNFTVNPCEFFNVPITAVGAMIYNVTDKSYGFVTSLSTTTNPNDTLNFSGGLTGGTLNKFNDNDSYVLIHFDLDGEYFYIDHKKVLKDNSGINGKYFLTTDTTQNFAGYEDGWFQNSSAGGPITSISTTTNLNDTINFAKGLGGQYFDQYVDNGKGTYQWQRIHAYKKLAGSDIYGIATGYYQFINDSIHDSSKDFSGLEGCVVINETTGSFARVRSIQTKVNPNDCLVCYAFTGGTTQNTTAGDQYRVYRLEDSFNHLLIKSTSNNPDNRNIRIVKSDDTGSAGFRIFNENLKFYGISFICSRSIGLLFLFKKGRIEKCRIMWSGKHAAQLGFLSTGESTVDKVFVYQNVMNNFPRGSTYGANGGWPQSIQAGGASAYSGVIIYDNGGEGVGGADIFENGIVIDNYSQSIYFEHAGMIIRNNVVGLFHYDEADWLQRFYYEDAYNFAARNSQKMHVGGITMAAENSGPHITISDIEIYNNIIIGCFEGISQYYEWSPNGLVNSFIANNTIILPSNHVLAPFEPCAGIKIRPSSIDTNSFIKNNIIIGSVLGLTYGDASRVNIFRCRNNGITTANIVCDKNLYSYPGISIPFTLTSDSAFNPSTFAQWKAYTGWDTNTTLTDTPDLVGTSTQWLTIENIHKKHIKLLSTSVGVDTGEDLSAYFTTDFDGTTRPSQYVWDKGALEYTPETEDFTKEAVNSLGTTDADLATDFFPVEYDYLESLDNRTAKITATNKYGVFLLKTKSLIGHEPLSIKWVGKTNIPGSTSTIYLQIYNRSSTTWETLTSNNSVASNTQFTMTATKEGDLDNYYDSNDIVACRIYQQAV